MDVAISTLLSPIILFFALGMAAALLRSQMSVPEAVAKGMAIYLMMAIGLKGGVEMSKNPLTSEVLLVLAAGIVLSFMIPAIAFVLLRLTTKLDRVDAAATAAHYGSISIVTFVAATEAVRLSGLDSGGHLVAVAALMETPAIITALVLAARGQAKRERPIAGYEQGELVREVFLNASIVVLVGALIIGWVAGEEYEFEISFTSSNITVLIDGPDDTDPWGHEAVYAGDSVVGRLTSGGYSVAFGKQIGMGYAKPEHAVVGQKLKIKMHDQLWDAEVVEDSPYDPKNERIRIDG